MTRRKITGIKKVSTKQMKGYNAFIVTALCGEGSLWVKTLEINDQAEVDRPLKSEWHCINEMD